MKTERKPRLAGKRRVKLPKNFTPKLFSEADNRFAIVKELKRRCERLMIDTAADSMQKRALCQEAVFVGAQLETMRTNAAQGRDIDLNSYIQMVNCFQGLLGKLGLDKQFQPQLSDLQSHINKNYGKNKRTKRRSR